MYIEAVPNRNSPPAILLRESYRHEGKVRKRTLCNLSDWSPAHVEGLRGVLKGGTVIPAEQDAFTVTRSLPHGYKGGWIIESCFRRMKQTGLQVRPMFHWTPRRIEAHVKLCVLALQLQRAAEIRCGLPWARIAHALAGLKAVRYCCEGRAIVQRTKIAAELAGLLKNLGISMPKQLLAVEERPQAAASA